MCMERIPKKELHGQCPVVTFPNKAALNQFEAQSKTRPVPPPNPGPWNPHQHPHPPRMMMGPPQGMRPRMPPPEIPPPGPGQRMPGLPIGHGGPQAHGHPQEPPSQGHPPPGFEHGNWNGPRANGPPLQGPHPQGPQQRPHHLGCSHSKVLLQDKREERLPGQLRPGVELLQQQQQCPWEVCRNGGRRPRPTHPKGADVSQAEVAPEDALRVAKRAQAGVTGSRPRAPAGPRPAAVKRLPARKGRNWFLEVGHCARGKARRAAETTFI
ncbi:proline-rich protein 2-like [Schistocerca gregaria]|uniref:proline-rich protein 2-like n=1 Tax=Schistocerca gregaria TaxID=7010 RepID=UPI00211DB902|nr:proline-rich protein 2-like [Schistocerca gregaria]